MANKLFHLIHQSYDASTSPTYIQRLCSSWLLPPWLLFAYRALISLYAFVVLFTIIGYDTTHGNSEAAAHDFSYFTDLTYWGLAFYFPFAAAHTASYALRGQAWPESWPKPLRYLHSAFYVTITVYPFIVTAVFWGVLAAGAFRTTFSSWTNISEHTLNSVFAFLEILLPRSDPHPWIQLIPIIIIAGLYLALAYVTHATEHFYVYSFLNPANGRGLVAGACIGILAGMIIVLIIVRYLILFRKWITEDKLGFKGKSSKRTATLHTNDVERMTELSKSDVRTNGIV